MGRTLTRTRFRRKSDVKISLKEVRPEGEDSCCSRLGIAFCSCHFWRLQGIYPAASTILASEGRERFVNLVFLIKLDHHNFCFTFRANPEI
jgi:hypothetical protein